MGRPKGTIQTPETIEKRRLTRLKNKTDERMSKMYKGRKLTPEWIANRTKAQRGKRKNIKNRKSPEDKIIRRSIEYRLWREAVFARDNWTCQKYGIRGGTLHPHHILNFSSNPELRFAIDNGVTLSEKAHREFHKKYGNKDNTKEQIEEFLNIKYDK